MAKKKNPFLLSFVLNKELVKYNKNLYNKILSVKFIFMESIHLGGNTNV